MRKKTYRTLIMLAVIVIAITVAATVSLHSRRKTDTMAISDIAAAKQPMSYASIQEREKNLYDVPPSFQKESSFVIHFFDVGEADSALIECDGHYMLIDGGSPSNSSFLYSYLEKNKIDYLDYIVCSHAHNDHVGGLAGALNYASVGIAYAPTTEYDGRAFSSFVKYLSIQSKEIVVPISGDTVKLGSALVSFLGPIDKALSESNTNNSSIILRIEYENTSFLFTGDAEIEEEQSLINSNLNLQSTLLKVGHHGSSTSSSEGFLTAVSPEYAVISVGKNNEYEHPHDAVLDHFNKHHTVVYRTDLLGEIICYSDGTELAFEFAS